MRNLLSDDGPSPRPNSERHAAERRDHETGFYESNGGVGPRFVYGIVGALAGWIRRPSAAYAAAPIGKGSQTGDPS